MVGSLWRWRKSRARWWVAGILLSVVALAVSISIMGPSPPRKIRLATGEEMLAYHSYGQRYKEQLEAQGLTVELVPTSGSIENLRLLLAPPGERVDVAFVQGGLFDSFDAPRKETLRGMAALYLEPIWVFYRGTSPTRDLADFKGRKIAIGEHNSGTEALSKLLLEANGIAPSSDNLLNRSTWQASRELLEGKLDAAIFVAAFHENSVLEELLLQERPGPGNGIRLMSFERSLAYTWNYPFLTPVRLPEGVLNLEDDLPPEEKKTLAPAALLVCREDFNPKAVELILRAAQEIHARDKRFTDVSTRFPSLEPVDWPIHPAAETYMQSGESLVSRLLPYWAVRLVFLANVLVLPLLVVWLPFLRTLPLLYTFRVNRLLKKHYVMLRNLEKEIEQAKSPQELCQRIRSLENLRTDMEWVSRKVPAHLQRDVYHWRLHIWLVQAEALERLQRMEAMGREAVPAPNPETGSQNQEDSSAKAESPPVQ